MYIGKNKGFIYLIVVLLTTSIGVYLIQHFSLDRSLYRYTVAIPGIIALLFLSSSKLSDIRYLEFFRQFRITSKVIKWLILSLLFYTILSYVASFLSSSFLNGKFVSFPKFQIPISKVWLIFVLAFLEEIGWRGFGLPHLIKKTNVVTSSILIGVIWALWHFPGYLVGFGAPSDIPFIIFSLWVIASSFIFTWLYIKSNANIWTAVLLHFGANMALQLYPIMPSPAGTMATFCMMTSLVIIIAIILSIKYLAFNNNQTITSNRI